jgi:hypothetical protein
MKKLVFLAAATLLATGCADKKDYEQAVMEQVKQDKDLQDYKIDPVIMTDCVVKESSTKMPGLFPFDPQRMMAYRNYAKMLKLNSSSDPKKTLDELRQDFGSAKDLAEAHSNFTETFVNCMAGLVTGAEQQKKD